MLAWLEERQCVLDRNLKSRLDLHVVINGRFLSYPVRSQSLGFRGLHVVSPCQSEYLATAYREESEQPRIFGVGAQTPVVIGPSR